MEVGGWFIAIGLTSLVFILLMYCLAVLVDVIDSLTTSGLRLARQMMLRKAWLAFGANAVMSTKRGAVPVMRGNALTKQGR